MSQKITDNQTFTYSLVAVDKKGQTVPVDGVPVWSSSNTEVATLAPAADGLSAVLTAVVPGVATISVTDGNLAATDDVTVVPGAAVTVQLKAGAVSEQG